MKRFAGTSAGSMVAMCGALGLDSHEMEAKMTEDSSSKLFGKQWQWSLPAENGSFHFSSPPPPKKKGGVKGCTNDKTDPCPLFPLKFWCWCCHYSKCRDGDDITLAESSQSVFLIFRSDFRNIAHTAPFLGPCHVHRTGILQFYCSSIKYSGLSIYMYRLLSSCFVKVHVSEP